MEYHVIRSHRRSLALVVQPDGSLTVRAPWRMTLAYIDRFVMEHQSWIKRTQQRLTQHDIAPKRFVHGEEFLFLGQSFRLENGRNRRLLFDKRFVLIADQLLQARSMFIHWYRKQAREIISRRLRYYAPQMNARYDRLRITSARHRWGSCSNRQNLNFTWRLVMAPLDIIDSVVVHELAHTKEPNHSRHFWQHVSAIIPDHKERRAWLNRNANLLNI